MCCERERSTLLHMTLHPLPNPQRPSACYRHPRQPFTGFCASCLRERLAGIDPATRLQISAGSRGCNAALRRSKSCSGAKFEAVPCLCELPRRKSCDVRVRNTLWDLFNVDDEKSGERKFEVEMGSLGFEIRENAAAGREITDSDPTVDAIDDFHEGEIELKTMKEFIDLEWGKKKRTGKDFRHIAGSVWEAASVFSKKVRKWRQKQKTKSIGAVSSTRRGVPEKTTDTPNVHGLRETQSEVGDYGLGRRSCDTDTRLSVDAGRMSIDNSLYSFDEPRASWDGCLIGRTCPRLMPMASVMEEAKLPGTGLKKNMQIESNFYSINEKERSPGGSMQTKDYYMDPISPMRRRSFDRSNSHRKSSMAEVEDLKLTSNANANAKVSPANANAKVSPATTELFCRAKLLIPEEDLNDTNSEVIKDCKLDGNEYAPEATITDTDGIDQKRLNRAYKWHKMWSVLRFAQKQRENNRGNEESFVESNANESLQKLKEEANGSVGHKLIRSYSVINRDPSKMGGCSSVEIKGSGTRRREDVMSQKNRSVRYSPNNLDHGLLRFYLTPLRSYRRSNSGKSKLNNSLYISRNVV